MFATGGDGQSGGMLGTLMTMLVAEKAGVKIPQHKTKAETEVAATDNAG